ncbi:O-methyltransferase [Autumnicola psychrophila]|uniref:Class I SAM-dependent methyltransferase n=1 Tax=Autumnicola psychrophila TaxID=3075592 RepID=A0ABU3DT41_9FLAO|nr:class I SAM-dependent methyltransferase [Zunongwangia sp. F225]MDT0686872.1 class I SAM-dependent methyltransferase [Zunongwangia sp. F225]
MHLLKSYIKFLLKSQNQHGLHSPFVYELVTKCFYDKKFYPAYDLLKSFRRSLLKNDNFIKVTDFGAGSRVFKSEKRKISAVAKNAGISGKRARLLYRLVNYLECKNVLELGTSLGIATSAIAANRDVKVLTLEGCPETANIAQQQFEQFRLNNIQLKIGKFEETLEEVVESGEWREESEKRKEKREERKKNRIQEAGDKKVESGEENPKKEKRKETKEQQEAGDRRQETGEETNSELQTTNYKRKNYDLIFFDGNHQKQPTLAYFHKLLPGAKNSSVFIFDDIHWSPEMEEAWEEIKDHPQVTVSIDTFYWGLIFFRKEQAKQHFNIRL